MRAQRVDARVGGGAVGAGRALRRVRVEVVPAVGHLLAARLAAPQRRAVGHGHEHAVVRVLRADTTDTAGTARQPRAALCNRPRPLTNRAERPTLSTAGGSGPNAQLKLHICNIPQFNVKISNKYNR